MKESIYSMTLKTIWFVLFVCLTNQFKGQSYERPNKMDINVHTIKWKKTSSGNFLIYYKPTGYSYNLKQDFYYFTMENGDVVIFDKIGTCYMQLNDFGDSPTNVELEMSVVTCYDAVFLKSIKGGFVIYDRGKYVGSLVVLANNYDYVCYGSNETGKKYWIPTDTYYYGSFNTPHSITSE